MSVIPGPRTSTRDIQCWLAAGYPATAGPSGSGPGKCGMPPDLESRTWCCYCPGCEVLRVRMNLAGLRILPVYRILYRVIGEVILWPFKRTNQYLSEFGFQTLIPLIMTSFIISDNTLPIPARMNAPIVMTNVWNVSVYITAAKPPTGQKDIYFQSVLISQTVHNWGTRLHAYIKRNMTYITSID